MALSSSNISPTCRAKGGRCTIRSANLGPGLARPPAPTAGAFFFREFVPSADSAPAPQIAPLPGNVAGQVAGAGADRQILAQQGLQRTVKKMRPK